MTQKEKGSNLSMAIFMIILFSIVGLVVLYPFILWYLYINDKLMYRLIMKKTVAIILCMVLGIVLFP
jgi:small-conductance mechanosensitive channel